MVLGKSGTGLGLTIVWNTIQEHGGTVLVSSDERGTRFALLLPATGEKAAAAQEKEPIDSLRGNGKTILIVDDESVQREVASRFLVELGYQPQIANSGEEAVKLVAHQKFDLLLLDMIMDPGINGRQTYERIIAISPGQPAMIASGFSENEEVRWAQELGAGPFNKKLYTATTAGLGCQGGFGGKERKKHSLRQDNHSQAVRPVFKRHRGMPCTVTAQINSDSTPV